ncbi:MAG: hypothetical protein KA118_18735 [Verrucomicrobia bacterium]|nr:hypothetical protein [Verrucomicrobiota bacterium]
MEVPTQTAVSGLKSWQTSYRDSATAVTTVTESTYGTNGTRTVTVTAPDGSSVVSVYSYGRPQSVTHKDSGVWLVTPWGHIFIIDNLDSMRLWRKL